MRRIVKVLSVLVRSILLTVLFVVALGVISRTPLLAQGAVVLVIVLGAFLWGRRMDRYASQSWFIRMHDVGATTAHDRLLQHIDADREVTHKRLRQRRHDAD